MITSMKLTGMTGVGYGQKATLTIPTGPTHEELILKTNLPAERLKRISVTLNADEIYVLSGEQTEMLEAYKKRQKKAGYFILPFSDISGKSRNGIRATGLVTEKNDNITLEVVIGNKEDGDPDSITMEWSSMVSPAQPMRIIVPRIEMQTMQAPAAGENEFLGLKHSPYLMVRRAHFASDKMTALKITRDRVQVHESDKGLIELQAERHERAPQAGYYHFDPVIRGWYMQDTFPTTRNHELKLTATTSEVVNHIDILIESFEIVRPEVFYAKR